LELAHSSGAGGAGGAGGVEQVEQVEQKSFSNSQFFNRSTSMFQPISIIIINYFTAVGNKSQLTSGP
jgi:hypothetical protein